MEGLRGVAVILVFLVHYVTLIEPWLPEGGASRTVSGVLFRVGHSGVDLFFVLSGYVIYGALIARPRPFVSFLRRRLQRIYPAFAVILLLYLGLSFVFPNQSKLPPEPGPAALYIAANAAMLPGLFNIVPIITVAWSLSYELFFYIALPMLLTATRLRGWSPLARVATGVGLGITWLLFCAYDGGAVRLIMFGSGMVLYDVIHQGLWRPPSAFVTWACLLAGLAIVPAPSEQPRLEAFRSGVLSVCFFVVCHASFGKPNSVFSSALSWTPIRWLGNMSYSFYLVHGLVLKSLFILIAAIVPPTPSLLLPVGLLFTTLVLSTIAGAMLYLLVERPVSLRPGKTLPYWS